MEGGLQYLVPYPSDGMLDCTAYPSIVKSIIGEDKTKLKYWSIKNSGWFKTERGDRIPIDEGTFRVILRTQELEEYPGMEEHLDNAHMGVRPCLGEDIEELY